MRPSLAALAAVLAFAATPAVAGIADSPLPELLPGAKTVHLYSVPGVIAGVGGLGTVFACTSTATQPIQVGVEIFSSVGGAPTNDGTATSLNLNPGATALFGTALAAGFNITSNLAGGGFSRGSARILATSKNVICTAFLADFINPAPTAMTYLTIVAKVKQKAAN
jgi:hypothetical protein